MEFVAFRKPVWLGKENEAEDVQKPGLGPTETPLKTGSIGDSWRLSCHIVLLGTD